MRKMILGALILGIIITPTTRADVIHIVQDIASLVLHLAQAIIAPLTN